MKKLLFITLAVFMIAAGIGTALAASVPQTPALFETSLQAPITSSATTMTLTANSLRDGTSISGYNCFTIDEGSTQTEYVCGTVSGTSVTGLSRGISPLTGTTTASSLQKSHRRGASVKITNFPALQIVKALINGEDTIPNILTYSGSPCTVSSSNSAICHKAYIDAVAVSGASDANDTTKGIVELATGAEAALGTSLGGTAARLALGANLGTSTCQVAQNSVLVASSSNGKLGGNCFNTLYEYTLRASTTFASSTNFGFGTTTFANATTTFPRVNQIVSIGTTTPGYLNAGFINATSTYLDGGVSIGGVPTTTRGNLTVGNNASTTNLIISGRCTGCANGWERVTGTGAGPTSSGGQASVSVSCTTGKSVIGGGGSNSLSSSGPDIINSYPDSSTSWTVTYQAPGVISANTMTVYAICVYP